MKRSIMSIGQCGGKCSWRRWICRRAMEPLLAAGTSYCCTHQHRIVSIMRGHGGGMMGRPMEYELPREIHCLAVRRENDDPRFSLAAVGVKNVVKIIKIQVDPEGSHVRVGEHTTATISRDGVITDVAWNPNQNSSFLVCHSKGIIKYFNIETNQAQHMGLASPWSHQHDDNFIIKLSWNASDRKLFGAAIRGAQVRLYDTSKAGSIGSVAGKGARDISFHPTIDDLLLVGDVDNAVKVYDRRKLSEHLFRFEPFDKSSSLTHVAWFPSHDPMTFITSSANMVKVWQATDCPVTEDFTSAKPAAPIHSSNPALTNVSIMAQPTELHKIHVPGTLKSILTDNGVITTLSSLGQEPDTPTSTSIFDLDSSYTAQSIIRGQYVTCVDWLSQNNQQYLLWGGSDGRLAVRHPSLGYKPRDEINHVVSSISSQGHLALHNPAQPGRLTCGLALFEDLDAAKRKKNGAEGTVSDPALLQLLARSYHLPWNLAPVARNPSTTNHLHGNAQPGSLSASANASAISSRVNSAAALDQLGLGDAAVGGGGGGSVTSPPPLEGTVARTTTSSTTTAVAAAAAAIGVGWEDDWRVQKKTYLRRFRHATRFYRDVMRACRFNIAVATRAGLHSRAAVWSALIALLPRPEDSFAAFLRQRHVSASQVARYTGTPHATPGDLLSPDADTLLQDVLRELLDAGDALHYVLVREMIVRCQRAQAFGGLPSEDDEAQAFQDLSPLAVTQVRRVTQMYVAYIDLLRRLTLPQLANDVVKYVTDPIVIQRARADVSFKVSCALCAGSELRSRDIGQRQATAYCLKCRTCVSYCVVCCRPVSGLLQWCAVCGHGGHFRCLQRWFREAKNRQCPSGCGHRCCSPRASHSPNVLDELRRGIVALPQHVAPVVAGRRPGASSGGGGGGVGAGAGLVGGGGGGGGGGTLSASTSSSNLAAQLNAPPPNAVAGGAGGGGGGGGGAAAAAAAVAPSAVAVAPPPTAAAATSSNYRAFTTLSATEIRRNQLYSYLRRAAVAPVAAAVAPAVTVTGGGGGGGSGGGADHRDATGDLYSSVGEALGF